MFQRAATRARRRHCSTAASSRLPGNLQTGIRGGDYWGISSLVLPFGPTRSERRNYSNYQENGSWKNRRKRGKSDQLKQKHLIRGQHRIHWSPCERVKGSLADAPLITFQLMGCVALLQLHLEPRHCDCQGHIWWKHDEAAVYLPPHFPSAHPPFSLAPHFLCLFLLAQRAIAEFLITRGTAELIEHSAGPNFT